MQGLLGADLFSRDLLGGGLLSRDLLSGGLYDCRFFGCDFCFGRLFGNLGLLFFVAPAAAFQSLKRISLAKQVIGALQGRLLSSIALFLLALKHAGKAARR